MSKNKTSDNFNFLPIFLKGNGSEMDYYHGEFIRWRGHYETELNKLREMENPRFEPQIVRTWELPTDRLHPRYKANLYTQIDAYIKKNQSSTWVFSHIEEDMEERYIDSWDDYPDEIMVVSLYAILKDKNTIVNSDVYKQQVKTVQEMLDKLEEAKERFIKYMKEKL
ncbi:hypothetical protein VP14_187 [Vibrio phage VPMCC14]|nr:hypothetical protein VP14_187 [Vibrio phage VPMCC14]